MLALPLIPTGRIAPPAPSGHAFVAVQALACCFYSTLLPISQRYGQEEVRCFIALVDDVRHNALLTIDRTTILNFDKTVLRIKPHSSLLRPPVVDPHSFN